jgi:hypothetical protein
MLIEPITLPFPADCLALIGEVFTIHLWIFCYQKSLETQVLLRPKFQRFYGFCGQWRSIEFEVFTLIAMKNFVF